MGWARAIVSTEGEPLRLRSRRGWDMAPTMTGPHSARGLDAARENAEAIHGAHGWTMPAVRMPMN
jgi:hypothetical protein